MTAKRRVLLVSIVPPRNDCGVRIVMYRHFVDRSPFELHVASNADFAEGLVIHTQLRLPYLVHRLRKSRFGPRLAAWITDYENFIWPLTANDALEEAVQRFQPQKWCLRWRNAGYVTSLEKRRNDTGCRWQDSFSTGFPS